MLNEGVIVNDTAALIKSEMVRQIRALGPSTPDNLERAVFKAITGHDREEVDWDNEDNQAGYYTWIKSFDQLIAELIEDGYIVADESAGLVPTEGDAPIEYSYMAYPKSRGG
jgi:hypothetical protein